MENPEFVAGLERIPVDRKQHPEFHLAELYEEIGSFVRSGLINEELFRASHGIAHAASSGVCELLQNAVPSGQMILAFFIAPRVRQRETTMVSAGASLLSSLTSLSLGTRPVTLSRTRSPRSMRITCVGTMTAGTSSSTAMGMGLTVRRGLRYCHTAPNISKS
jgi:hypothetical protein